MIEQFVWAEKYRPRTIAECALPDKLEKGFTKLATSGKSFNNMVFFGGPGIGKTTVARALCEQTGHEYILINGSKDLGIADLRTTIQDFASSVSLRSHRKCVIVDEADGIPMNSTQMALRGFMEEFAQNCSFIFTVNYKYKLMKEMYSRGSSIDFSIPEEEKKVMLVKIFESLKRMLNNEGIKYEDKILAEHLKTYYPDFRKCVNELQAYANSHGVIDAGILSKSATTVKDFEGLTDILKEKNFDKLYAWVISTDYDPSIYSDLFEFWHQNKKIKDRKIGDAVILVSDYEERQARGANPKVTLVACLTQVMLNCEFV